METERNNSILHIEEKYGLSNLRRYIKKYKEEFPGKNPLYGNNLTQDFLEYLGDTLNLDKNIYETKRIQFSIQTLLNTKIEEYSEITKKKKSTMLIELLNWYFDAVTIFKDNEMPFSVDHITNYCRNLIEDDINLLITKSEFIKYTTDSFNAIVNGVNQVFDHIKNPSDDPEADKKIIALQEKNIMKYINMYYATTISLWEGEVEIKEPSYEILVLDDDIQYHIRLQNYFNGKRSIKCVSNYIDFVISLKKEKPKIILIDILLSGKRKGHEICQLLKSRKLYRDIPIIVISASSTHDIDTLKEEYKADEFYQKKEVINLKRLNRLINNYIN